MSPHSYDLIKQLIAFDTVSRHSNLALIQFIQQYLSELGVESQLIHSDDQQKANLFATIGPNVEGGVVLSGHTDVVPVDGQAWDTDPFVLTQRDGKLYGRGTCDMKAFIAIALAKVPAMLRAGLKRPIHLAFSYDEEIGCLGAPRLIDHIARHVARPAAVIVGEPSLMQPVVAHKGILALNTTVSGLEAHSSQVQRGVSAITLAARLISHIDDLMRNNQRAASQDSPFTPPYTTLHTGVINGGTAINIMARECSFVWDIRNVPGEDTHYFLDAVKRYGDELLQEARQIHPGADIVHTILADVPALQDQGGPAQDLIQHLQGCTHRHAVPFAAEGGQFQQAGYSVVICGPGSIDQAHQANEFIDIEQISQCESFLEQLIARLAT